MRSLEEHDQATRVGVTENDFVDWLVAAQPGDQFVYHRGFLALDTYRPARRMADLERLELVRLAEHALRAASHGLVFLVQRRHGEEDYSYLAIARPRPNKAPVSLSALLLEKAA